MARESNRMHPDAFHVDNAYTSEIFSSEYNIVVLFEVIEQASDIELSWSEVRKQVSKIPENVCPDRWIDLGGCILLKDKIENVMKDVREKRIMTVGDLLSELEQIHSSYRSDELSYVCFAVEKEYGFNPLSMRVENVEDLIVKWESASRTLNSLTLENTKSEFSDLSRISYGIDQDTEMKEQDFSSIRGSFEEHPVVKKIIQEKERIAERVERIERILKQFD